MQGTPDPPPPTQEQDTLRTLELFGPATKKAVDYSDYTGANLIRLDLPKDSNLSLGQVVSLHATNPALFGWCTPAPAAG